MKQPIRKLISRIKMMISLKVQTTHWKQGEDVSTIKLKHRGKKIRAEVLAAILADPKEKINEVVVELANGQAVGKAGAGEDDDSTETPLRMQTFMKTSPKTKRTNDVMSPTIKQLIKKTWKIKSLKVPLKKNQEL